MLELGFNRIPAIENISHLVSLEELWLGRNRIAKLTDCSLQYLTNLKKLSLQSNRIESMKGLCHCVLLEELLLGQNGISKIEVFTQI